jgi:peptidoglycan/xylan/chitin deacetylase (PgdA/CDA1 family)
MTAGVRRAHRVQRLGLFIVLVSVVVWITSRSPSLAEKEATFPEGLGTAFEAGTILHGGTPHRILHFTFDDGPSPETTPRLLQELDAVGVKATFFFSASRFADNSERNAKSRELAKEVWRRGHNIGSHSVDHKRMKSMTAAQVRAQLDQNDKLFTEIFGRRTFLFRPPWGSHSLEVDRQLAERDNTMVLWNIGSADWVINDAQKLETTFMRALPFLQRHKGWGGGIVLMHDTHPWTVAAFPKIIANLRARNCELLGTNEELFDIRDDLSPWKTLKDDKAKAAFEANLAARQVLLRKQTQARCSVK